MSTIKYLNKPERPCFVYCPNVSQQQRDEKIRQPTVFKNQYVYRLKLSIGTRSPLDRDAFKPRWHDKGLLPRRFVRHHAHLPTIMQFYRAVLVGEESYEEKTKFSYKFTRVNARIEDRSLFYYFIFIFFSFLAHPCRV